MGDFLTKIRLVFVPLFGALAAATVLYSALNWFLTARGEQIPIDADLITILGPMAIAFGISLYFMATRLKRLAISTQASTLFFFLAWAAVIAPLLIIQLYVSSAAGGLVRVASADQIADADFSRFYIANSTCLDKENILARTIADVHGRNNEDLEYSIHVAVPVCGQSVRRTEPSVWIALVYRKTVDNRMSDAEKDAALKAFFPEADKLFNAEDPRQYRYLSRLGHDDQRSALVKAFEKAKRDPAKAILLVPHTDAFEQRSDGYLSAALISLLIGVAVWLGLLAWAPLKTAEEEAEQKVQEEAEIAAIKAAGQAETGSMWEIVVPTRKSYGLPVLLDVNVLVFLVMVFSGLGFGSFDTEDLLNWGANYGPMIHGLGVLRLFTSQFVHGGFMHIASNMYGLLFVTMFLLPVASNARLIGCYLIAGLGASLTSVWIHPDTVSVGASGALFGLCGVLLVLLVLRDPRLAHGRGTILANMAVYVALNLAFGAATPGIDNAAHVGGLISGLVIGVVLYVWDRARTLPSAVSDDELDSPKP